MQSFIQYRRLEATLRRQIKEWDAPGSLGPPSENEVEGSHRDSPSSNSVQTTHHSQTATPPSIPPAPNTAQKQKTKDNELIMVGFDIADEELNPRNWNLGKKIRATAIVLGAGLSGGWASASDSTIIPQAKATFGVSEVTESLSTGLYLVAFGVGSLVSGPFSETVGRNPVYITALILFMIFVMASGLAPNIGAQLIFRFFAGLFGCTAATTFAGSVGDLWSPAERDIVLSITSTANFCGVFLAPVVSSFIGRSTSLSWRWSEWVTLLISGLATTAIALCAPETYAPVILSWKAAQLRRLTGNTRFRSDLEVRLEPLWVRLLRSIHRPFWMFFHEITVALFTAYLTVLYIVAFTFLTGFPFIYGDIYQFSQGSIGLCFLSLDVGILLAGAMSLLIHKKYIRDMSHVKHEPGQQKRLPPEERLWFAMISGPCLPIGLFLMAWTSFSSIAFWPSLVGSSLIGFTFLGLFVSSYLYIIDAYEQFTASALGIATCVRYAAAGAMVPVSIPMYENLGAHWTLTLLGCISLLLTPLPYAFYKYGPAIRKRSSQMRN